MDFVTKYRIERELGFAKTELKWKAKNSLEIHAEREGRELTIMRSENGYDWKFHSGKNKQAGHSPTADEARGAVIEAYVKDLLGLK